MRQRKESGHSVLRGAVTILIVFSTVIDRALSESHEDVVRLEWDIFSNYSKTVRPVRNQSEATIVYFQLYFINIQELDMRTQLLISSGWHMLTWQDDYLTWDPAEYGGLEKLHVRQDRIWLPDISFYNTKPSAPGRVIGSHSTMMVTINSTGGISWEPDFSLESTCKVDISYFPFDAQNCEIQFCSWTLKLTALKLIMKQEKDTMLYALENGEYEAEGLQCKLGTWSIAYVKCRLKLIRRVNFYIYSLIVPLVILSLLTLVSFLVPVESGEKLTVSMTTLLSFTVYLGVLDSLMPKTSENVSILLIYVTVLMALSLLSVTGNATVLYLYHRGVDQSKKEDKSLSGDHGITLNNAATGGCEQKAAHLFLDIWKRLAGIKKSDSVQLSRTVNRLFLVALSVFLILTMICIAALYKYY